LPPVDPECKLYARMAGLVVPYGYPLEEHFVETVSLQQLLMLAVASTFVQCLVILIITCCSCKTGFLLAYNINLFSSSTAECLHMLPCCRSMATSCGCSGSHTDVSSSAPTQGDGSTGQSHSTARLQRS
jgi:hypothetical protein